MSLGEKIRRAREAKGWSQAELAKRVGISQPAIKKIEAGQTLKSRFLSDVLICVGLATAQPLHEPTRAIDMRHASDNRRRALKILFSEVLRRVTSAAADVNLADPTDRKAVAEVLAGLATAPLAPDVILDDENAAQMQVETAFHLLFRSQLDQ